MKADVILMASGASERFGDRNKLTEPIGRVTMFEHTLLLAVLLKMSLPDLVGQIRVVTCYDEIKNLCDGYEDVEVIYNSDHEEGMAASLRLGVAEADDEDSYLILPCDLPYLKESSVGEFLTGYRWSGKKCGCMSDGQFMMSPAIFNSSCRDDLLALQGDVGARKLLSDAANDCYVYVVKEKKELLDIDRPEQIRAS